MANNEGGTAEPRISENEQGTGGIPLIRLAAREDGWYGMGPEGFSDEKNPTLYLRDGTDYEIIWQNLDGERHNLVIADSNGDEMASTEPVESNGELQSVVITATNNMTRYLCPFHSNAEQGDIEFE